MLVFRGTQKSSRKSNRLIDELRKVDAEALRNSITKTSQPRRLPKVLNCLITLAISERLVYRSSSGCV